MFSIFVDERTDISSTKFLCTVLCYFSEKKRDVVTQLLEVIPMDAMQQIAPQRLSQQPLKTASGKKTFEKHPMPGM